MLSTGREIPSLQGVYLKMINETDVDGYSLTAHKGD